MGIYWTNLGSEMSLFQWPKFKVFNYSMEVFNIYWGDQQLNFINKTKSAMGIYWTA